MEWEYSKKLRLQEIYFISYDFCVWNLVEQIYLELFLFAYDRRCLPTHAGELFRCGIKIVFGLHPVAPEIGESPSFRNPKVFPEKIQTLFLTRRTKRTKEEPEAQIESRRHMIWMTNCWEKY